MALSYIERAAAWIVLFGVAMGTRGENSPMEEDMAITKAPLKSLGL